MPYKIDFLEDGVYEWTLTEDGAVADRISDYTPTLFAALAPGNEHARQRAGLGDLRDQVASLPQVVRTDGVLRRIGFRHDEQPVLRIDVDSLTAVRGVASFVSQQERPGTYRLFNVDFSREFRYCLENGISPVPERPITTVSLSIPAADLSNDQLSTVTLDDEKVAGTERELLTQIDEHLRATDPDLLVVNRADIVPTLYSLAETYDTRFQLGRKPGVQELAGRSTYTSYGRVGHSPARYNVPGRVVLDESNTFFWSKTSLAGILDLVERSGKPLQEVGWASIGNVLTAIQIQEATQRNVLVPWKAWRPERFKTIEQLREADRGGFTFSPDVGIHDDVHELDFSSMYPNIICQHNISPETIRCDCHADRKDVPGLGYSICDEPGYLPDVLQPLIDDRDEIKATIKETGDDEKCSILESRSGAIKWILVSCFGYQGFSNAKFGRIECHEAINAFARDLLLDAKAVLEEGGWRVVHGIVDSIWVTPDGNVRDEDRRSLETIAADVTERAGIRLEYEAAYDWVAFVPQRNADAGALTKYFGKKADEDDYKYRGIESRQRSTPQFVKDAQHDLIETLDEYRAPEPVCDRLERALSRLRRGDVEVSDLTVVQRISKRADEYAQYTRAVSALERVTRDGRDVHPGESVFYVIVDDSKRSRERVRLEHEVEAGEYDAEFYADLLVRAAASVVSPLGWREEDVRNYLADRTDASLAAFDG